MDPRPAPAAEVVRSATRTLQAAGVDSAHVEAQLICAHVLGIDRGRLERSTIPAEPSARNLAAHFRAVTGETMNIFAATDGGQ